MRSRSSLAIGVCQFRVGRAALFPKPAGLSPRAALVATLGMIFAVWDVLAIAAAAAGPWPRAAGLALLLMSTTLFWRTVSACASTRLTAIFEPDVPQRLVRRGPYRSIRHPFYASYTLFWFAGWIASGSILSFAAAAVMLAIYVAAARREERKFQDSSLADEYARYRLSAGLLCPRIRRCEQCALAPKHARPEGRAYERG